MILMNILSDLMNVSCEFQVHFEGSKSEECHRLNVNIRREPLNKVLHNLFMHTLFNPLPFNAFPDQYDT